MKKIICCLFACLPFLAFCQQIKTVRLFGNTVEINLPEEFIEVGDKTDTANFVFEDRPYSIRFSILTSETKVSDNDIPDYASRAIDAVKKQRFPATIFDDGISLNSGKNISYIKYSFEKEAAPLFEYVFYGSLNDKLLTFYFKCEKKDRDKWEKKIDSMVATLKIND